MLRDFCSRGPGPFNRITFGLISRSVCCQCTLTESASGKGPGAPVGAQEGKEKQKSKQIKTNSRPGFKSLNPSAPNIPFRKGLQVSVGQSVTLFLRYGVRPPPNKCARQSKSAADAPPRVRATGTDKIRTRGGSFVANILKMRMSHKIQKIKRLVLCEHGARAKRERGRREGVPLLRDFCSRDPGPFTG